MGVCYICAKTLISRPDDYRENREKYVGQAIAHEEHIIQNAIYGRLKSNNILCEKCGGNLGGAIDADFCDLFSSFTERLRPILASKNHGSNSFQKSLNGYLFKVDGSKLDVRIKRGKVVTTEPDYEYIEDGQVVHIFATQKVAKYYRHKVISELKKNGVDIEKLRFEVIDDLSSYGNVGFHFSEGVENFNDKFKMGLNKIAMGFAMSKGIDRIAVPRIFDTNISAITFTGNVVPFYPFGALELALEPFRAVVEDGYPTHTLILFTERDATSNRLICYIDLFSTFQYYVILNDKYEGDEVLEQYSQTILKQELPDIDIRANRWKHLLIIAEELGVEHNELYGKSTEEVFDLLETKKRQRTVNYKKDIIAYFGAATNRVVQNIMLKGANYLNHLNDDEKQIIQSMPDLDKYDLLSINAELQRIETDFFYRRNYIEYTENDGLVIMPTVAKMMEISRVNQELFVSYGHLKFFQLSQFIQQKESEMDK
tara:strand:- start:136 stop:1587 length:1452 start_codon:yes stop_codon:yes gene_type:complete